MADILQAVGAFAVYAVDTLITKRPRSWNYRRIGLAGGQVDASADVPTRAGYTAWRTVNQFNHP
jgi:hypothetical protein